MTAELLVVVLASLAIIGGAAQTLALRRVADHVCRTSLPAAELVLLAIARLPLALLALFGFANGPQLGVAVLGAYWLGRSVTLVVASMWRLEAHAV